MTCASCSTDASRYRSSLAPLPRAELCGFRWRTRRWTNLLQQLKEGEAIAAADTILTVPNQLDVDYNAHVIDSILTHVAPALGWR